MIAVMDSVSFKVWVWDGYSRAALWQLQPSREGSHQSEGDSVKLTDKSRFAESDWVLRSSWMSGRSRSRLRDCGRFSPRTSSRMEYHERESLGGAS